MLWKNFPKSQKFPALPEGLLPKLISMYIERETTFPSTFTFHHSKVAPPLSLILLSILSVSLLHSSRRHVTSYLAEKGKELRIKNPQTYTTVYEHNAEL